MELNGSEFWFCSRKFCRTSISGAGQMIDANGEEIKSSRLGSYKKQDASVRARQSFYEYLAQNGQIPRVTGDMSWAIWPLDERFCRAKLILHQRGWKKEADLKGSHASFQAAFLDFLKTPQCPAYVNAIVEQAERGNPAKNRAMHTTHHSQHDDESFLGVCSRQSHGAQEELEDLNDDQISHESVMQFPDGGPAYDWIASAPYPTDGATWLAEQVEQARVNHDRKNKPPVKLPAPIYKANKEQRALIMLCLQQAIKCEHARKRGLPPPPQERIIGFGLPGVGKSFVIKIIIHLCGLIYGSEAAVWVGAPTGMAAYIAGGLTNHSGAGFGIPCGASATQEFLESKSSARIQENFDGVRALIEDEKSMIGRSMLGWLESRANKNMNYGKSSAERWGGLDFVVLFGDDNQLPAVGDTALSDPTFKATDNAAIGVDRTHRQAFFLKVESKTR